LQPDKAIVTAANCNRSNYDNEEQNGDEDAATERKFVHSVVNGSGNAARSQR
jgi:hypothetical protein